MDEICGRVVKEIHLESSGPEAARANRLARELVTSRHWAEVDISGHALFAEVFDRAVNPPPDVDLHIHLSYLVAALAAVGALTVIVGARVAADGILADYRGDCALMIGEDAILRTVSAKMTDRPVI